MSYQNLLEEFAEAGPAGSGFFVKCLLKWLWS